MSKMVLDFFCLRAHYKYSQLEFLPCARRAFLSKSGHFYEVKKEILKLVFQRQKSMKRKRNKYWLRCMSNFKYNANLLRKNTIFINLKKKVRKKRRFFVKITLLTFAFNGGHLQRCLLSDKLVMISLIGDDVRRHRRTFSCDFRYINDFSKVFVQSVGNLLLQITGYFLCVFSIK